MEPVFHYLIPVLGLFALFPRFCRRFGYKKILLLGLLVFLPDFDMLTSLHRIIFHNIFFVIILSLILFFILGKVYGLLSFYFLGSHLLFDLGRHGIALLWPFYRKFMGFEIGLMEYKTEGFKIIFDFFTEPFSITEGFKYSYYLHPMGALAAIFIVSLVLIRISKK